jgi:hypothetical protein
MKKLREILGEDFSKGMKDWLKNNETTRKIEAREPKEPSKFPPPDPFWSDKMNDRFNSMLNRVAAPKTVKPEPVDTTGANSPFADPQVKSYIVSPDKPMVGKDDAVKKALAAKGYGPSGEKLKNPLQDKLDSLRKTQNDYHDKFAKDMETKFQQASTKPKPKVGALVAPQSGYPAAKKETLAPAENQKASSKVDVKVPIPKARPANLAPKKQTFDQAFAAARKAKLKKFEFEGKEYNTRLK